MPSPSSATPHVLLVEDDPVSAEFLRHAVEDLPARVDVAGSVREAMARAAAARHQLWLIDAHLPDGDGPGLLAALRRLHPDTPALAHTADADARRHGPLLAAGFADVLVKPLVADALRSRIAGLLGLLPDWDDARALRALGGQAAHVASLRRLFLDELPEQHRQLQAQAQAGDFAGMQALLHRLRASCAFVGAERLGRAVRALQADPGSRQALDALSNAAEALIES